MKLYKGRPESLEGRLTREIRTYDFLDELGIEYDRTDHEPANNMLTCAKPAEYESISKAVVGASALDEESLVAVQAGVPYVGYHEEASESMQELLPDVQIGYAEIVECLGYVTYPEETPYASAD